MAEMVRYKPKFPCQICEKACKWGQQAVACDECESWHHKQCLNMNTIVYQNLVDTSNPWICCNCGLPNFASSLFDTSIHIQPDSTIGNETSDLSLASSPLSNIGQPITTSSPISANNRRNVNKHTHIRIVNINIRSLRGKKAECSAFA